MLIDNEEAFNEFLKDYQVMMAGNKKVMIIVIIKESSKKHSRQVFIIYCFKNYLLNYITLNFWYCRMKFQNMSLQLFAKFLDHPVHFCQTQSDAVRHSQTHKNFLIFRLSIDSVIVERCIIARWNRLVETNRMVPSLSFYDHWINR